MVKDAQAHAEDDKTKKDEITLRNETDQLIYQTEKNLKDMGESMGADDKAKLEAALERAKQAIKDDNIGEITSARDGLNAAWHEVASKTYGQQGQQASSPPPGGEQAEGTPDSQQDTGDKKSDEGDGAVDADYEVVE